MTIASEIARLQEAKNCIKTAIEDKGVEIGSNVKIDNYADYINEISTGISIPLTDITLIGDDSTGNAKICWQDPNDDTYRGYQLTCRENSKIVRKLGSEPSGVSDGDTIATITTRNQYCSTPYVDSTAIKGCTYYYKIFSSTSIGDGSCSNSICLTPRNIAAIEFLLVGGGGSGGSTSSWMGAGGGGAGAVIYCNKYTLEGSKNVVIGSGGSNSNGGDSCFGSIVATGGGKGGAQRSVGCSGGSGGGGGGENGGSAPYPSGGSAINSNYGKAGGCGGHSGGAGGGGYCTAGGNGASRGGAGGCGFASNITGTSCNYGFGGGGGAEEYNCGGCAYGGAGAGGGCTGAGAGSATSYGSGGGGGYRCRSGGSGKQGIFVVRYPTSCGYNITGGTKYTCGDYTIHCFTSNGTLSLN